MASKTSGMTIIPRIVVSKASKDGVSEKSVSGDSLKLQKLANDRKIARLGRELRMAAKQVLDLNAHVAQLAALQIAGFLTPREARAWTEQAVYTVRFGAPVGRRGIA